MSTHSKSLQTRRRKQKGQKELARIARGAKKLKNQGAAKAGAKA